jgi:hypothetical protein
MLSSLKDGRVRKQSLQYASQPNSLKFLVILQITSENLDQLLYKSQQRMRLPPRHGSVLSEVGNRERVRIVRKHRVCFIVTRNVVITFV